jgi:hypothetical protein
LDNAEERTGSTGTEEWLEEAMVATNRLLRLVPTSFLKDCIGGCRRQGVSLQSIAGASHRLGLIDTDRLAVWQETIPHPGLMLPQQPEITAFQADYGSSIERCRFLSHYLMGITKEIPVDLNWQPDENVTGALGRIVGELAGQSASIEEKEKEGIYGDSHSNSA